MKKAGHISIFLLITILFTSCVTSYKIAEAELNIVPYKGSEVLVFESQDKEIDTIFLKKYDGWSKTIAPYQISHNRYEKYGMQLNHADTHIATITPSFLIELNAFNWKGSRIDVRTESESYIYKNKTSFTKPKFDSIPLQELRIGERTYSDVKIMLGDPSKTKFKNPVIQFYWSIKQGLIGWDTKRTQWRLLEKYTSQNTNNNH